MKKGLSMYVLIFMLALSSCQRDGSKENELKAPGEGDRTTDVNNRLTPEQIEQIVALNFPVWGATYEDILKILSENSVSEDLREKIQLQVDKANTDEIIIRSNYGHLSDTPLSNELLDVLSGTGILGDNISPSNCEAGVSFTIKPTATGYEVSRGISLRVGTAWTQNFEISYSDSSSFSSDGVPINYGYNSNTDKKVYINDADLKIGNGSNRFIDNSYATATYQNEDGRNIYFDGYHGYTTLPIEQVEKLLDIAPRIVDECISEALGENIVNEIANMRYWMIDQNDGLTIDLK